MIFKAVLLIYLKEDITDFQGLEVKEFLEASDIKGIDNLRIGKVIFIHLNAENKDTAIKTLEKAINFILVNPLIEDYKILEINPIL